MFTLTPESSWVNVTMTYRPTIKFKNKELASLSMHIEMMTLYQEPSWGWDRSKLSVNPKLTAEVLRDDIVNHRFPHMVGEWNADKILIVGRTTKLREGGIRIDPITLADLGLITHGQIPHQLAFFITSVDEIEAWDRITEQSQPLMSRITGTPIPEYPSMHSVWNWSTLSWRLPIKELIIAYQRGYTLDDKTVDNHHEMTVDDLDTFKKLGVVITKRYHITRNATPEQIQSRPDLDWYWEVLLQNRHVNWALIQRYLQWRDKDRFSMSRSALSRYNLAQIGDTVDIANLLAIPGWQDLRWDLDVLSGNARIPVRWLLDCIKNNTLCNAYEYPDYNSMSSRATLDEYLDFPNRRWNLDRILSHATMRDLYRTLWSHKRRWKKRHLVQVSDFDPTTIDYRYWCPIKTIPTMTKAWSDLDFHTDSV